MSGRADRIREALEAGEALRERLEAYRAAWSKAARSAAAGRRREESADLEPLRRDWERTADAFRRTAERIAAELKTLGREC